MIGYLPDGKQQLLATAERTLSHSLPHLAARPNEAGKEEAKLGM